MRSAIHVEETPADEQSAIRQEGFSEGKDVLSPPAPVLNEESKVPSS